MIQNDDGGFGCTSLQSVPVRKLAPIRMCSRFSHTEQSLGAQDPIQVQLAQ